MLKTNKSSIIGTINGESLKMFCTASQVPVYTYNTELYNSIIVSSYNGDDSLTTHLVMPDGNITVLSEKITASKVYQSIIAEMNRLNSYITTDLAAMVYSISYDATTAYMGDFIITSKELTSKFESLDSQFEKTLQSVSSIEETAENIKLTVSDNYSDLTGKIENNTSLIEETADSINLTVSKQIGELEYDADNAIFGSTWSSYWDSNNNCFYSDENIISSGSILLDNEFTYGALSFASNSDKVSVDIYLSYDDIAEVCEDDLAFTILSGNALSIYSEIDMVNSSYCIVNGDYSVDAHLNNISYYSIVTEFKSHNIKLNDKKGMTISYMDEITSLDNAFPPTTTVINCRQIDGSLITSTYNMCNNCTSLISIILPENLNSLDSTAFTNCNKLNLIILETENDTTNIVNDITTAVKDLTAKNIVLIVNNEAKLLNISNTINPDSGTIPGTIDSGKTTIKITAPVGKTDLVYNGYTQSLIETPAKASSHGNLITFTYKINNNIITETATSTDELYKNITATDAGSYEIEWTAKLSNTTNYELNNSGGTITVTIGEKSNSKGNIEEDDEEETDDEETITNSINYSSVTAIY